MAPALDPPLPGVAVTPDSHLCFLPSKKFLLNKYPRSPS